MRRQMPKDAKENKQRRQPQSPFIKYMVTAVSAIIMLSCAFVLAFFQTDLIIDGGNSELVSSNSFINRIRSSTVRRNVEQHIVDQGSAGGTAPGSATGDPMPPGVTGNLSNTSDWYTDRSGLGVATANTTIQGVPVYNGWPWDNNSDLTQVNVPQMLDDWIVDVASYMSTTTDKVYSHKEVQFDADPNSSASLTNIDGIDSIEIAYYPSWCYKSWYVNDWNDPKTNWNLPSGGVKGALVFTREESGRLVTDFIPVVPGDNKGHTYPGGVAQTWMKFTGNGTYQLANNVKDSNGNIVQENPYKPVSGTINVGDGAKYNISTRDALNLYIKDSGYALYYFNGQCKAKSSIEANAAFQTKLKAYQNYYAADNLQFIGVIIQGVQQ